MSDQSYKLSAPMRLIIRLLLTILLVYLLSNFFERIFFVEGGLHAYIVIGSLITLMNVLVRPLLHVLLLPFKLFMGIIVLIASNALFLMLTERIAAELDPAVVMLQIDGGMSGWLLVAIIFGLANWMFKEILR